MPDSGFKAVEGVTRVQVWALEWQDKGRSMGETPLMDDDNFQDVGNMTLR